MCNRGRPIAPILVLGLSGALCLGFVGCSGLSGSDLGAQEGAETVEAETVEDPAQARLIADVVAFRPGRTFRLGVLFSITDHWHIYWHSAREGGLGTQVLWQLPEGWSAGPIAWPTPKRFVDEGPIVSYGYEREVLLTSEVTVPPHWKGLDPVTLGARLSWLACKEFCVIGEAEPTLTLLRGDVPNPKSREILETWQNRVPSDPASSGVTVSEKWTPGENGPDGGTWEVTLRWPDEGVPAVKNWSLFPFDLPGGRLDEGRSLTEAGRTVFTFRAQIDDTAEFRPERLGVVIAWTETGAVEGRPESRSAARSKAFRVVHREPSDENQ